MIKFLDSNANMKNCLKEVANSKLFGTIFSTFNFDIYDFIRQFDFKLIKQNEYILLSTKILKSQYKMISNSLDINPAEVEWDFNEFYVGDFIKIKKTNKLVLLKIGLFIAEVIKEKISSFKLDKTMIILITYDIEAKGIPSCTLKIFQKKYLDYLIDINLENYKIAAVGLIEV